MLLEAKSLYPNDAKTAAQLAANYLELQLPGEAVLEYGRALALSAGGAELAELHMGRGEALARLH
ncbi:hypothetical protein, partial [Staphylococcus aureus]|uniref:hypothetical protein n=1 Tax=Staphylococcus aureus TaxID=1280 RepID=UPI003D118410